MIKLTLFPNEDILTKEIQAWSGFADALREEDRVLFFAYARTMLPICGFNQFKGGILFDRIHAIKFSLCSA